MLTEENGLILGEEHGRQQQPRQHLTPPALHPVLFHTVEVKPNTKEYSPGIIDELNPYKNKKSVRQKNIKK